MREQAPRYLALCQGPIDDKAVEGAIDAFADKEGRERFYKFFKEVETLYEIISPDPFLREYLDDYARLSALYQVVRNAFTKRPVLYAELARKTESILREKAETFNLGTAMPLVKIDEKTLEALKKPEGSETTKVINLGKSLIQAVDDTGDGQPYLIPIGERAETILEAYDDRQINTQDALRQLEKLLTEYVQASRERAETGFDLNTFTIYWILKRSGAMQAEKIAPLLDAVLRRFPSYSYSPGQRRQLKAELYKLLLPAVGKERMVELAEQILRLQRK
jgi:type I restriction enzyme R subunit